MLTADVVIVGAGPVGAFAAYALAQKGVNVILCEAGGECAEDMRASTFHPPTLEILHEIGVADELVEYGLISPKYHIRKWRTGEFVEFDLGEIADCTPFPFRLQCEQHVMVKLLVKHLERIANATVLFNHRAVWFAQNEDGVVASFETPFSIERIKARYLIGADGGNSIIRKWLGADFDGFTYPEKFLTLSTTKDLSAHIDNLVHVNYVVDPKEWLVLLRAPSAWRILVPADEAEEDAALLSDANCDAIFTRLIGEAGVPTSHRTVYRVHQRVVNRFNHGRVFLAGDSAHLNNPIGGFGMNSGIHDAWNLLGKMLHGLAKGHDDSLFDLYDRQRRSVTNAFIQAQAMQNKDLLEQGMKEGHERRFAHMQAVQADPAKRREFLLRQSMIESVRAAAAIH